MISVRNLTKQLLDLDKKVGSEKAVDMFVEYTKHRGVSDLLPHVLHYLERIQKEEKKRLELSIESPYTVSSKLIEDIRVFVGADKDATVVTNVEPKLLGGFSVEYNFKRYDATLHGQLEKMRTFLRS